MIEAADK